MQTNMPMFNMYNQIFQIFFSFEHLLSLYLCYTVLDFFFSAIVDLKPVEFITIIDCRSIWLFYLKAIFDGTHLLYFTFLYVQ